VIQFVWGVRRRNPRCKGGKFEIFTQKDRGAQYVKRDSLESGQRKEKNKVSGGEGKSGRRSKEKGKKSRTKGKGLRE